MQPSFRFFTDNQLLSLSFDELLTKPHPELVGAPMMLSTGLKVDNQPVVAEDILVLDTTEFTESNSFWRSYLGQKMQDMKFDQAVIHITQTRYHEISYTVYIKKDGKFVSHNEYDNVPLGSDDYESGNGVFSTSDTGIAFLRYICLNKPELAGNTYFNPELLPGKDRVES